MTLVVLELYCGIGFWNMKKNILKCWTKKGKSGFREVLKKRIEIWNEKSCFKGYLCKKVSLNSFCMLLCMLPLTGTSKKNR